MTTKRPSAAHLKVYKLLVKGGPRRHQTEFGYEPKSEYIWCKFISPKRIRVQAFRDGILGAISSLETAKALRFKSDKYGGDMVLGWGGVCEIEDEIICFTCYSHTLLGLGEIHAIKFGNRSHWLLEEYPELHTAAAALAKKLAERKLEKIAQRNVKAKPAKPRTKV